MTDLDDFKKMLNRFGVDFTEDYDGETHIYIGGIQVRESTSFIFTDGGKFDRYDIPLVDSCLTRRM